MAGVPLRRLGFDVDEEKIARLDLLHGHAGDRLHSTARGCC